MRRPGPVFPYVFPNELGPVYALNKSSRLPECDPLVEKTPAAPNLPVDVSELVELRTSLTDPSSLSLSSSLFSKSGPVTCI